MKLNLSIPGLKDMTLSTNPDIEPMPPSRRHWGFWSFFGYWGIPNITIWTWSTGSALIELGLNIKNIMGCLTLGNVLICLYTCLNSGPGLKYHIGYSICQRMIFGIHGSNLGIVIRIIISIIFYGAQSWLGGLSVVVIISSLSSRFMSLTSQINNQISLKNFIGFIIFQVIQLAFFVVKPENLNKLNNLSCLLTMMSFMIILIICLKLNHGPGSLMNIPNETESVGWSWLRSISIWYGALSPDITNQCDYSRFASRSTSTYLGICCAIMITGTFVPLASLFVASSTNDLYGEPIWLPTDLCLIWLKTYTPAIRFGNFLLGITFFISQLTFNLLANGFTGGMGFSGLFPKYFNNKRGAILTGLLSWIVQPWNIYTDSSIFLVIMSSFGIVVTPILSLTICDYIFIRNCQLPLSQLYSTDPHGAFYFWKGFNLRCLIIWFLLIFPGVVGLISRLDEGLNISKGFDKYFYGSAIFLFVLPFGTYYVMNLIWPINLGKHSDEYDYFGAFTLKECKLLGIKPKGDLEVEREGLETPTK